MQPCQGAKRAPLGRRSLARTLVGKKQVLHAARQSSAKGQPLPHFLGRARSPALSLSPMGDGGRFAAPLSLQAVSWLESGLIGSEFRFVGIYKRSFSLLRGALDAYKTERHWCIFLSHLTVILCVYLRRNSHGS